VLFLGLGTSLFGTADGVRGKSAGLVGFAARLETESVPEECLLAKLSEARSIKPDSTSITPRLREVRWSPSMISSLNVGDHSGTSMPPFIRRYVMPLLSPETFPAVP
jgi:hypothetical protein